MMSNVDSIIGSAADVLVLTEEHKAEFQELLAAHSNIPIAFSREFFVSHRMVGYRDSTHQHKGSYLGHCIGRSWFAERRSNSTIEDLISTSEGVVRLTGDQVIEFEKMLRDMPPDRINHADVLTLIKGVRAISGYSLRQRPSKPQCLGYFCGRWWYVDKESAIAPIGLWPKDRLTPMQKNLRARIAIDAARYARDTMDERNVDAFEHRRSDFLEALTTAIETHDTARTEQIERLERHVGELINIQTTPMVSFWPATPGNELSITVGQPIQSVVQPEDGSWNITLACGHKLWWPAGHPEPSIGDVTPCPHEPCFTNARNATARANGKFMTGEVSRAEPTQFFKPGEILNKLEANYRDWKAKSEPAD